MKIWSLIATAVVVAGCDTSTEPLPQPLPESLQLTEVVSGLSNPVLLTAPAGDTRLFIVEQTGAIRIVKNGQLLPTPFLNISSKLIFFEEQGLLGLAFHPQFATNGFFYVYYIDLAGNTKIERYHAPPSSDVADAGSGTPVLSITRVFNDHNGGMMVFGPDNMLWIGTGDGGGFGADPLGNGQKLTTLLGKMLRINVNGAAPYTVPSSNPFVGQGGGLPEIWAYGLRNPWRFSFDRPTGLLYIADVGLSEWEEVDVMPASRAGVNYGWNIMEGARCLNGASCNVNGLDTPVLSYSHDDGCAIVGGYVYRGNAVPGIRGHYFYSDFCSGFLRSFRFDNGAAADERSWDVGDIGFVLSMGEDGQGELYVLAMDGTVYKLTP